jgi:hypothetical protein
MALTQPKGKLFNLKRQVFPCHHLELLASISAESNCIRARDISPYTAVWLQEPYPFHVLEFIRDIHNYLVIRGSTFNSCPLLKLSAICALFSVVECSPMRSRESKSLKNFFFAFVPVLDVPLTANSRWSLSFQAAASKVRRRRHRCRLLRRYCGAAWSLLLLWPEMSSRR